MRAATWEGELERWLAPFLEGVGRKERRRWAPVCVRGLLALRPFRPKEWTDDPARCRGADVPAPRLTQRTEWALALDEIDRVRAAGVTFGCVLADAGYGMVAAFRRALSARGLTWAVGIPRTRKGYPPTVTVAPPVRALPGRPPRARRTGGRTSCPARPSGASASGAPAAGGSSTSATTPSRRRSRTSPAPSRRAGRASRPTSSSGRNRASTTSRAAPGLGSTVTRYSRCSPSFSGCACASSMRGAGGERTRPTLPSVRRAILTVLVRPPRCPRCRAPLRPVGRPDG